MRAKPKLFETVATELARRGTYCTWPVWPITEAVQKALYSILISCRVMFPGESLSNTFLIFLQVSVLLFPVEALPAIHNARYRPVGTALVQLEHDPRYYQSSSSGSFILLCPPPPPTLHHPFLEMPDLVSPGQLIQAFPGSSWRTLREFSRPSLAVYSALLENKARPLWSQGE